MWGVEFREAKNSLIGATATFEVKSRRGSSHLYQTGMGPRRTWLEERIDGEWIRITNHAETEDFEAILPTDFGFDWTYADFMVALTFFGEGFQRGYNSRRYGE